MKQIQITDSVDIIELPEGSRRIVISKTYVCYVDKDDYVQVEDLGFEPDHLTQVQELSEDECKGMVYKVEGGYLKYGSVPSEIEAMRNMGNPWFVSYRYYKKASLSLESLLKYKGFIPSNCYAVVKR